MLAVETLRALKAVSCERPPSGIGESIDESSALREMKMQIHGNAASDDPTRPT